MNFISTDSVSIFFVFAAMSKSPKPLPNCLEIAETGIILKVFQWCPL
jgi:hypothetical protein